MLKPLKSELTLIGKATRHVICSLSLHQLFAVAVTMAVTSILLPGWSLIAWLIALPIAVVSAWANGRELNNEQLLQTIERASKSELVKSTLGRAPALAPIGLTLMVSFVIAGVVFGAKL